MNFETNFYIKGWYVYKNCHVERRKKRSAERKTKNLVDKYVFCLK